MPNHSYKICGNRAGPTAREVFRIVVPAKIAELIPEDQEFVAELTEDGLLYRPINHLIRVEWEKPSWAKENPVGE